MRLIEPRTAAVAAIIWSLSTRYVVMVPPVDA
jgi:hypothetical protein